MENNKQKVNSKTPKEALKLFDKGAMLVDIRADYLTAYKYIKVEKQVNIPFESLADKADSLSKKDTIIIADSTGILSKKACQTLLQKGFTNIYNLAGGIVEWERDGLPLFEDISERLTGACPCQLKPRDKK